MKRRLNTIYISMRRVEILKGMRRFISPLFIALLCTSFVLWYVAKLTYSYTTDIKVSVKVEGERFETTCVVEGVGTNLFGYKIFARVLNMPLSDLKYDVVENDEGESVLQFDQHVLMNAISVHCSDIKIVSIDTAAEVVMTERMERAVNALK